MMSNAIDFGVVDDSEELRCTPLLPRPYLPSQLIWCYMSTPLSSIRPSPGVRSGDEPLLSGEEEVWHRGMNGILRNLWWNITMTGRCSICLFSGISSLVVSIRRS